MNKFSTMKHVTKQTVSKKIGGRKQIQNKDSAIKRETNKFKILTTCVMNNDNNDSLLSHKL